MAVTDYYFGAGLNSTATAASRKDCCFYDVIGALLVPGVLTGLR